MKIAVLVKQVPDTATKIVLAGSGVAIEETGVKWVVNPYDEFAIEAALQIKQQVAGAEVVIISAGPERATEAIRTALAMGADRAVRIDTTGVVLDSYLAAVALAAVVQEEGCTLVLGGKQAVDDDASQVLQGVAERLGWPQVALVEKLAFDPANNTVTVHRPVTGALKEVIDLPLPAVVGCDKGLNAPRYPSLPGIMKAKSKPVAVKKAADCICAETAKVVTKKLSLPAERAGGKKVAGTPEDVAEQLVQWLKTEVKLF